MKAILIRWRANGGSAFDPFPTLKQHLVHMLVASCLCLSLRDIVAWFILGPALTVAALLLEYSQYKGWIGARSATKSDSQFDVYQYQAHWIWYWPLAYGVVLFLIFAAGYRYLLLKLVNEKGDPV